MNLFRKFKKDPKLTKDEHNDIIKLYDQKFAKQGLFVRKKYDSILANREARCLI